MFPGRTIAAETAVMYPHVRRIPPAWARAAAATSSVNADLIWFSPLLSGQREVARSRLETSGLLAAILSCHNPVQQLHHMQDLLPGLMHLRARAHLQQASWIGRNNHRCPCPGSILHLLRQQFQ